MIRLERSSSDKYVQNVQTVQPLRSNWNDLFLFYFDSKFEIKTTVHKQAEWREKSRGSAVSRKVMK
jgi:hypothetical protein